MKRVLKVKEIVLNDEGKVIAAKGGMVKVFELSELEERFMSHQFDSKTRKIIFWSGNDLDYIGG